MDLRFTPTSASWVNVVEGFFSKLTRQRLKNAVFDSLDERLAAIYGFIGHTDENGARPSAGAGSRRSLSRHGEEAII